MALIAVRPDGLRGCTWCGTPLRLSPMPMAASVQMPPIVFFADTPDGAFVCEACFIAKPWGGAEGG